MGLLNALNNMSGSMGTILGALIAIVANVVSVILQRSLSKSDELRIVRRNEYFQVIRITNMIDDNLRKLPQAIITKEDSASSAQEKDQFGVKVIDMIVHTRTSLNEEALRMDLVADPNVSDAPRQYQRTIEDFFNKVMNENESKFKSVKWNNLQHRLNKQRSLFLKAMRNDINIK
ncbi:MAG: hypothetical protein SO360_07935 [Bifidobacterium tsurumiense]|uniref:hypothetical protein n=1 Tax=Bifidobacterium tsurumiense TaxID=356829 RepID=UPI002A819166|nr:hypothetical protein [Bifidobacterium tsurumiense]MDY4678772.1 hypothetical protein [Bifidobacterium tsurumiense]